MDNMSTEAINRQRGDAASKDDRTERAMRAVKVFRGMQYGLTSYARAITGNRAVRVEIGTGAPHTNGEVIFYRPPIRLGDDLRHDRMNCDKRGVTGLLVCQACAIREEVLVNIYHEIAHIAFDTFAETTDEARRDAIERAVDEWGSKYADHIKSAIESAPESLTRSYLGLAKLISPFLPHLLNCLEDARVDGSMFEARKGTKKMLTADTYSLLRDGIPQPDGSVVTWEEAPLNSQAGIACYFAGAGYAGWQEYLHPQVGRDFTDATIQDLVAKLQQAKTAVDTYTLSFSFLARLRELGYFKMPDDPEDEDGDSSDPGPDEEASDVQDEAGDEAGDPGSGGADDGEASEEAESGSDDSDDGASGDDGSPGEGDDAGEADGGESEGSGDDSGEASGGAGAPAGDPDDTDVEAGGADDGRAGEADSGEEDAGESGADGSDPGDGDQAGGGSDDDEAGDAGGEAGGSDADEVDPETEGGAGGDQSGDLADDATAGEGEVGPEDGGDADPGDDDRDAPEGGAEGSSDEEAESSDGEGVGDADSDGVSEESGSDGGSLDGQESSATDGVEDASAEGSEAEPDVQPSESGTGGGDADTGDIPGDDPEVDPGNNLGADQDAPDMDGPGQEGLHGSELDDVMEGQLDAGGSGDGEVAGDASEGSGDSGSLSGGFDYSAASDSDSDATPEVQSDGEADGPDDRQSELGDDPDDEGPAEAIDSGADQGLGGIRVEEADEPPLPEYGTPEDFEGHVNVHEHIGDVPESVQESDADQAAVEIAVMQGLYFETPSANVSSVVEHRPTDDEVNCFTAHQHIPDKDALIEAGIKCDTTIPESILGPNLMALRRYFSDNKRSSMERNRRSGKVNARTLGRRAWNDDERLFQKKRIPGKRDYAVLIGIDISSSTLGMNLALAKRAAMAQAELCSRLGISFAVFAHCCGIERNGTSRDFSMEIYRIKDFDQPWNPVAIDALSNICGMGGNLDGHTMEFYRKELDKVEATDKVLLYYTDGKMPAANHAEELEVLQREIKTCRMKNYTLLGVGIRTDSPIRHGLDTVQVDDDADLRKVVDHLGKRLARPGR